MFSLKMTLAASATIMLCMASSALGDSGYPTADAACIYPTPGCPLHNHSETHISWRITWDHDTVEFNHIVLQATSDECCTGPYEEIATLDWCDDGTWYYCVPASEFQYGNPRKQFKVLFYMDNVLRGQALTTCVTCPASCGQHPCDP